MGNFIVKFSTCDWLIPKFVSKFCLGGLGPCIRTVNILPNNGRQTHR